MLFRSRTGVVLLGVVPPCRVETPRKGDRMRRFVDHQTRPIRVNVASDHVAVMVTQMLGADDAMLAVPTMSGRHWRIIACYLAELLCQALERIAEHEDTTAADVWRSALVRMAAKRADLT